MKNKPVDDETAVFPVVQAFTDYYRNEGPEKTEGLIAGLIKYKADLDRGGMPLQ